VPAEKETTSTKKAQGKGAGKGENFKPSNPKTPTDNLVKLDPVHWDGQVVQPAGLSVAIAEANAGSNIICGIIDNLTGPNYLRRSRRDAARSAI